MMQPPEEQEQSIDGREHCSTSLLAEIHALAGVRGFYLEQEP